jgi:hypothetical protein
MFRVLFLAVLIALCAAPLPALAAEPQPVPKELVSFVPPTHDLIDLARADLDGDGLEDALLVLQEKTGPDIPDEDGEPGKRRVLILTRTTAEGGYELKAASDKAIFCEACGGVFGDPYNGVGAGAKTFTIHLYGGSNWRWAYDFRFIYSRLDQAWELEQSTETSFHTSEPDKQEIKVYTSSDFGKIRFQDFDPETYRPPDKD